MEFFRENPLLIFLIVMAFATLFQKLWQAVRNSKNLEQSAKEGFGKPPLVKGEIEDYIRDYHKYLQAEEPDPRAIDAITWNDLNMDALFQRINRCNSSVGEEYLYYLLHTPSQDPDRLERRNRHIRWMEENEADRTGIQKILLSIGRKQGGMSFYLFHAATKRLGNTRVYLLRALLPLLGIPLAFFHPVYGIMFFIVTAITNILTYYRHRLRLEMEIEAMRLFSAFLYAARRLEKDYGDRLREVGLDLAPPLVPFLRAGGLLPGRVQSVTRELEEITVVMRAAFLWDFIKFNYTIDRLAIYREEVGRLFVMVGEADLAISAASFRKSLPAYCVPEFTEENRVAFTDLIHPLLEEPVANSGRIDNDAIITGSNASGKSTFIKTIAVNHILAQSLYTCTAKAYTMRPSYVCSSMALKDDILAGESYFIAEIKSLKRIIAYAKERPCICFIDEILRGTNTPERIAASTAVLRALHETDSLCLIASHDLELTEILKEIYDNFHFRETFTDGEITFDYKLKDGPSTTTNAIRLLEHMGFEPGIVEEATRLVQKPGKK